MKKLSLCISAFLLLQASPPPSNTAIELSGSWQEKNLVYKSKNHDFCDYSIRVDFGSTVGYNGPPSPYVAVISSGEMPLFTLRWDGTTSVKPAFTYYIVRGNLHKKPNVEFLYALPVKQGDSVRVATKDERNYTLRFDLQHASDTVYACRGGIVCDNRLVDTSTKGKYDRPDKITIYHHNDGTMADYTIDKDCLVKKIVSPGDNVKVGDPIAVVKAVSASRSGSDKSMKNKEVSVGIYFLDKNKLYNTETGSKHTNFVPVFHTTKGGLKLLPKTTYCCEITDQMLITDMGKREKSQYFKNKTKK